MHHGSSNPSGWAAHIRMRRLRRLIAARTRHSVSFFYAADSAVDAEIDPIVVNEPRGRRRGSSVKAPFIYIVQSASRSHRSRARARACSRRRTCVPITFTLRRDTVADQLESFRPSSNSDTTISRAVRHYRKCHQTRQSE